MKNSVNQHSVLPVSFECIDGKRFRFHQIGPMTHLKKQFSKNFFFSKKVGPRKVGWGWSGLIWWGPHPSTPNEKTHFLLTFKHFIFYFHDIFPPFFFPM